MRNLPLTEVERKRVLALMAQQAERMADAGRRPADAGAARRQPAPGRRPLGRVGAAAARRSRPTRARCRPGGTRSRFAGAGGRRDRRRRDRAAERDRQPGQQRGPLHARRRPRSTSRWRVARRRRGELAVSDTGLGIAREHLPRLTERFYRVDGSRSRDTGGTGLGLAIVKHVVQRHGGELDIASEPGKGSTFRLRVPGRSASGPAARRGGAGAAARRRARLRQA